MKKMYYDNYICQKLGKIENLNIKKNKSIELKKSMELAQKSVLWMQNQLFVGYVSMQKN